MFGSMYYTIVQRVLHKKVSSVYHPNTLSKYKPKYVDETSKLSATAANNKKQHCDENEWYGAQKCLIFST